MSDHEKTVAIQKANQTNCCNPAPSGNSKKQNRQPAQSGNSKKNRTDSQFKAAIQKPYRQPAQSSNSKTIQTASSKQQFKKHTDRQLKMST